MIDLTLVIATYNRAASLAATLATLAHQTHPLSEWECVVVDNNSTDATAATVDDFAAANPQLRIRRVFEPRQGLSHARNRGIEESAGAVIAFVDDDELLVEGFVASYVAFFAARPDAMAAGGGVVADYPQGRPRWMSGFTEQPIANPMDWGDRVRLFPAGHIPAGGNMAFRREVFGRFGGFDPAFGRTGATLTGGEESDLFERLARSGTSFWYVPGAVIRHVIPPEKLTRDYFRRLAFHVGCSQRRRARLHGRLGRQLLSEVLKWCVTLPIAAWYLLSLEPSRAGYLLLLRLQITKGLTRGA